MTQIVQIVLPDEVANCAQDFARQTGRRLEEVLQSWIVQMVDNLPLDTLSDDQLLELCNTTLPTDLETELDQLLSLKREDTLDDAGRARLEALTETHRRRLIRKEQALKAAVQRGLIFPLR